MSSGSTSVDHTSRNALRRVALLDDDLHRCGRHREAQRLVERARHRLRLAGGLPLAVDRGEAARVDDAVRGAVDDLEQVLAEVRVVDRPRRIARPGQRLEHQPVEAEALLGCACRCGSSRGAACAAPRRRAQGRTSRSPGTRGSGLRGAGCRLQPAGYRLRLGPRPGARRRRRLSPGAWSLSRHLVNFLYLIRCGWSAAAPRRRLRSAS